MVNIVRNPMVARWGATAVLTAAVFGGSAGLQKAAETAPPLPAKMLTYRDIQLTVHARRALADDPDLAPANLGVRVQDNVAVLWGPVSSEALKRRAVDVVKKVKGVFTVKDADVYIAAPTVVVEASALTPPRPEAPTHTEAASPPEPVSESVRALTARPAAEAPPAEVVLRAPLPLGNVGPAQTVSAAPPGRSGRRRRTGATGRRPLSADRLPVGRRRGHSATGFRARRGRDGVRAGRLPACPA